MKRIQQLRDEARELEALARHLMDTAEDLYAEANELAVGDNLLRQALGMTVSSECVTQLLRDIGDGKC